MNPHHLRTFLAVRSHLNYTRAAEQLFLSQPAVSRHLRQLEAELGVRLFEQLGKTLHLTDAGRTLGLEATRILGALERAAEAVRAYRSAEHGSLRIGASTTPGLYLLPGLLGRFRKRYPGVELHYAVENSLRIERMIVRNELDLGFVGGHLANEDLDLQPVLEDEIVCFAAPSHPLARRRRIPPEALGKETVIIRKQGSATRRLFESWLANENTRLGKTIQVQGPEAGKILVGAGMGVSFMSVHGIRKELRRKRFRVLPVTRLRLRRRIQLVRHRDKHTTPVMEAFLALARSAWSRAT